MVDTNPGVSNVRLGTSYIFGGVTLTGTLAVPTPASGASGTIDLDALKERVRFILDGANNAAGDPINLSAGLTGGCGVVKSIMKLNPERINIASTQYPWVTIFIDRKDIEERTIAKNQATGKRVADIRLSIIGAVINNSFTSGVEDEGDNDCEHLMENIERILRSYDTIDGLTEWSYPESVEYHSYPLTENNGVRFGQLNLITRVWY